MPKKRQIDAINQSSAPPEEQKSSTPPPPPLDKPNTPPNNNKLISSDFTADDFEALTKNEHGRYPKNAKKIAHAVITKHHEQLIATQYSIPQSKNPETPTIRPLIHIEAIEPFPGMHRYRAETPTGHTPMYGKRSIKASLGELGMADAAHGVEDLEIVCFSPTNEKGKQPFWGSIKPTPLFNDQLSKREKKELDKELAELPLVVKGGHELIIDPESVLKRDLIKTRTPDQNTVMGESARDAYEHFFEKMSSELHPNMKQRLKRSFNADIKEGLFVNSHRPEWLHAKGWSLMPIDQNPQTADNLGAAPKWVNTQMMIVERIIRWFALNSPESLLTIRPQFEMLLDSELIKHIDFKAKILIKNRFIELIQSIDPFLEHPLFPKASDLAQGTAITHHLLNQVEPTSRQIISKGSKSFAFSAFKSNQSPVCPAKEPAQALNTMAPHSPKEQTKHEDKTIMNKDTAAAKSLAHTEKNPTKNKHDRSVVQIYVDSFVPDYDNPWRDPESRSCTGSGFVIEQAGKKYIVTNAHVVENATFIQLRLANDRQKKYKSQVKCVAYQCDLALLEVDSPEFHALSQPVDLGEMVALEQKVMVVGFPMGGTEVSVSKGVVSRIQVDSYSQSDQRLLQVQVDAAVNGGNSGGPVFSKDKVVGVAFQGYTGHQGLSYIIPIPIIQHFLTEAFSKKPYRGFPTLPMVTEELENVSEREFYNMGDKTGLRIVKIDYLSDAYSKLKPDDILLEIDGYPVSNEGTVDIPNIGSCIDFFHVTQSKFINDSVSLKILRKNPKNDKTETLAIDVLLDTVIGDSEKVGVPENDKMPTFYFNSGICYVPLTRNFMEGDGSIFEETNEDGCSLADAPKKAPDEQIIVINRILNCTENQGYEKHNLSIVKMINGKPINNIHDVIMALEENEQKKHIISLSSKSKIIIPNMSPLEQKELLKHHHISHDRSPDLETPAHKALFDAIHSQADGEHTHSSSDALYVDNLELTQLGMHALFLRMGYQGITSGTIYEGNASINLKNLQQQGFMPVLTDVGVDKTDGHWIMLIHAKKNQYYIFDPLGQNSGKPYKQEIAAQLPKRSSLTVIPNKEGLNRGLCGYWVASVGVNAFNSLKQEGAHKLPQLGEQISKDMGLELTKNGYAQIIAWLQSITTHIPGTPSKQPINAKELRLSLAQTHQANPLKAHEMHREEEKEKGPLKRKRVEVVSDEEDSTPKKLFTRSSAEAGILTRDMLPGLKKYTQKLNEMEQWYQSLPEDLDEDDDEDYLDQSDASDCSDEDTEALESESLSDEEDKPIHKGPIKYFTKQAQRQCHRFFKPVLSEQATAEKATHKCPIV